MPFRRLATLGVMWFAIAVVADAQVATTASPPVDSSSESLRRAATVYARLLQDAKRARQNGDLESALAGFTAVAEAQGNEVPPDLRAEAREGVVSVQEALRHHGLASLLATFVRGHQLILVFGVALVTIVVLLWLRARTYPRRGTLVSFEDLSASRQERFDRNRVLTRAVLDLLQDPQPVRMSDLYMDIMPGTGEPGFGNLQPELTMQSVSGFEESDRPLRIAWVEFSLRDIRTLLARYFSPPYEKYLEGWLIEANGTVEAGVHLLDSARKPTNTLRPSSRRERLRACLVLLREGARRFLHRKPQDGSLQDALKPLSWKVRHEGAHARERALADLAAKFLAETGQSMLTQNWQSFRSFHRAMALRQDRLSAAQSSRQLREARSHLEQSIAYDPSNWIARFSLALTLCRDDEASLALKHFETLENIFDRALPFANGSPEKYSQCASEGRAFVGVVDHLKKYPECAFLIMYNKAVTLGTLGGADNIDKALHLLDQLSQLPADKSRFPPPYDKVSMIPALKRQSRVELSLYALSAQASLIAGQKPDVATSNPETSSSREHRINRLQGRIDELCDNEAEEHWRSVQTARAVIRTARGIVLAEEGRLDAARVELETALAGEPRLVKALLVLAELYMARKEVWTTDWRVRARSLLIRVREYHPECKRASVLLSRLNADPDAVTSARLESLEAPRFDGDARDTSSTN